MKDVIIISKFFNPKLVDLMKEVKKDDIELILMLVHYYNEQEKEFIKIMKKKYMSNQQYLISMLKIQDVQP